MRKPALLAVVLLLLNSISLGAGAAWDEATPASPHVVTRKIEVTFPQLDFRADIRADVVAAIDQAIAQKVFVLLDDLLSLGNIMGTFDVTTDVADVLSLTIKYSGYHPPMAHPMHYMASITADLHTGKIYDLEDLFTDDTYVQVISREIERQVVERDMVLFEEFVAIAPDQAFFLKPDALVIYYQVYEIAPYVAGFPEFEIPLDLLADIARDDGPIGLLAAGDEAD